MNWFRKHWWVVVDRKGNIHWGDDLGLIAKTRKAAEGRAEEREYALDHNEKEQSPLGVQRFELRPVGEPRFPKEKRS